MSPSFRASGGAPERREALERQRHDLGICRGRVAAADRLDAGMQELAGLAGAQPEHRAEIAIARRRRAGAVEMPAADRDGVFGAKAELAPAASCVTNIRRRISSPERSMKMSAGCSTGGSRRA
jgi:hypothetical protein